jgi:hypothetical protein
MLHKGFVILIFYLLDLVNQIKELAAISLKTREMYLKNLSMHTIYIISNNYIYLFKLYFKKSLDIAPELIIEDIKYQKYCMNEYLKNEREKREKKELKKISPGIQF